MINYSCNFKALYLIIDNIGFCIDVAFSITNVQRCFAKLCIFTVVRELRNSFSDFESSLNLSIHLDRTRFLD